MTTPESDPCSSQAESPSVVASVLLKRFAILPDVDFMTPAAFLLTLSPFDFPTLCLECRSSMIGSTRKITRAGRRTANVSVAKQTGCACPTPSV
jgi:hypothetical protein